MINYDLDLTKSRSETISVMVIDSFTNKVVDTIEVGYGQTGDLEFNPGNNNIHVANSGGFSSKNISSDMVSVIDSSTNTGG